MTIVLDARTVADHFPGIGRYTVNLAQAMQQVAPDLGLALLSDSTVKNTRLTLPALPRIECPASPFSLRQQWQIPQRLRRAQARLYHSPYYLMPYAAGIPTVFTCHDLIPLLYPQYFTALQRLIYYLTHLLALRTAQVTIAVSQATKTDLLRLFRVAPRRIVVIPEAADPNMRPQSAVSIATVRAKYALPDEYVLYLGSNKPHKNLAQLVHAFAQSEIRNQKSEIKLVVAGHWEDRYPEAKLRAAELGLQDQIAFIGPVAEADLPALYSGALLFVFPSQYEGFGLPVLEAMACGTPVVCSNASSLPEVAGDAALLVNPMNTNAWAEAIGLIVMRDENRRDALRQRGLAQAARFSWERTARATCDIYEHCTHR